MAIEGWTGASIMMPVVRLQARDRDTWETWLNTEYVVYVIPELRDMAISTVSNRFFNIEDGCWLNNIHFRIHPDDLAALNALADAHGGTWKVETDAPAVTPTDAS